MPAKPPRGPLVPPVYFLAALLLMAGLQLYFPVWHFAAPYHRHAGIALMALFIALILWAAWLFHRAHTGIVPFTPATSFVAAGPYRYTRNPMYLGMAGVLLGAAVFLGTLTPFFAVPVFTALIQARFILAEEAMLEETFGGVFLDYKARVRRWL